MYVRGRTVLGVNGGSLARAVCSVVYAAHYCTVGQKGKRIHKVDVSRVAVLLNLATIHRVSSLQVKLDTLAA